MILQETILIIFYFITLFFSIILHEVAHGLMAFWLGDNTAKKFGRLTLDPIKHIDLMGSILVPIFLLLFTGGKFVFGWAKPVPYDPYNLKGGKWGTFLVALAGPLTNFCIAVSSAIIAFFIPILSNEKEYLIKAFSYNSWESLINQISGKPFDILFVILVMLIFWNILLGSFNLVPIPPLDGSKVFLTFFDLGYEVKIFLERWGSFILLIFLLTSASNILYLVINFFLNIFYSIAV